MGGFPWAHGRTIITTRAAEWEQQGEDSRKLSATDLQHCDWCGAGSLTMLKCGKCRLVYYCSIDCQKAARSKHKVVCVPKRNMDDVMGLTEPVAATAAGQQEQPAPSPNTPLLEMGLSERECVVYWY